MGGRGKGKGGERKGERMWRGPERGLPRGPCWLSASLAAARRTPNCIRKTKKTRSVERRYLSHYRNYVKKTASSHNISFH